MPISLDDFAVLQQRVDALRSERDRMRGVLETLTTRLKAEYNCTTVEEARALLEKLGRKERKLFEAYSQAKADFEKRWGEQLERLP